MIKLHSVMGIACGGVAFFLLAAGAHSVVAGTVGPEVTLMIQASKPSGPGLSGTGTWTASATITSTTPAKSGFSSPTFADLGLAGVNIDVLASGNVQVTSSKLQLPVGLVSNGAGNVPAGFVLNTSDGTAGVGIRGAQDTLADDPTGLKVLETCGTAAGTEGTAIPLSWTAPLILATGTYSCTGYGMLTVAGHASEGTSGINMLIVPAGHEWNGASAAQYGSTEDAGSVIPGVAIVPEPSALALLAIAVLGGTAVRIRTRRGDRRFGS